MLSANARNLPEQANRTYIICVCGFAIKLVGYVLHNVYTNMIHDLTTFFLFCLFFAIKVLCANHCFSIVFIVVFIFISFYGHTLV